MAGLMVKAAYLMKTGMTDGQFRGKIQRGQFIRNKHYFVVDRITWVDDEAIDEWIRSGGLEPKTAVSKSAIRTKERLIRTSSINRGTPQTSWKPVV